MRLIALSAVLSAATAYHASLSPERMTQHHAGVVMMAKSKKDPRVWLPQRSSPFAREVDVALQLVSRAAAGLVKEGVSLQVANAAAQALVCDGINSEFADDVVVASEDAATCDGDAQKAALELINELGATTPCVNAYEPPYPDAVKATELSADTLTATLGKVKGMTFGPERTWLLAPIIETAQPAISLTLLEFGRPVVACVALPKMPRNAMDGEKLLRMTVSFDGQSGALRPDDGVIMWAEENKGAYERSVAGLHGTDVPVRVDRSLIGKRDIASGQVTGVQDFADVTRCEDSPHPSAASLAKALGMGEAVQPAGGPFAYGLVARGEAQTYFELPDAAENFDSHAWAHAAGSLLVTEAGGLVTDTSGNPLDFSVCRDGAKLPPQVVGVLATNKDVHPDVVRQLGLASMEAAAK